MSTSHSGKHPQTDVHLGWAPTQEEHAQVGSAGYRFRARHECWALIQQLRRTFGPEPKGARLFVREEPHKLGIQLSVGFAHQQADDAGVKYAIRCLTEPPLRWDAEARKYLGLKAPNETVDESTSKRKPRKKVRIANRPKGGV